MELLLGVGISTIILSLAIQTSIHILVVIPNDLFQENFKPNPLVELQ